MEWISVEQELPPESRPEVLFYVHELDQIELGKFNEVTGKWIVPHRDTSFQNGVNWVTHWAHLPEPPKSK